MYVKPHKTFVYGRFLWPEAVFKGLPPPPTRSGPDIAIEILREFGTSEMMGKIYSRVLADTWQPLEPNTARGWGWYVYFSRTQKQVFFDMEGSGLWEVRHFRNESDENGPYVAVALRFFTSPPPPFVALLRKRGL